MKSNEQLLLWQVQREIGKDTVTGKKLELALSWIVQRAVDAEFCDAWKYAFQESSNCMFQKRQCYRSDIIFKLKTEENGTMRLNARFCPHENKNLEKGTIRSDSLNVQIDII